MTQTITGNNKPRLKIVFDGVIVVGPGYPDTENGLRDGPFFGVMARSTRRLSDRSGRRTADTEANGGHRSAMGEEDLYIPMHVPTIFTRLKPTKKSRPPDQVLQLSPWHDRWYLWHPVRERLEFRFDGSGKLGKLEYLNAGTASSLDHGGYLVEGSLSIHGIELVPDMRKIWRSRSVLLDGLLSTDPHINEKVMTQVLVPWGRVAGAGMFKKGNPVDVVFDPPRDCHDQQALVPNAVVMVAANTVEIAAYSLDSGRPLDSIELELSEDAEIWVSNGDPSDVEIDMQKLAVDIAVRLAEKKQVETKDQEELLKRFTTIFELKSGDRQRLIEAALEFYHGHLGIVHEGLARDHHRAGNVDLDFELYYSLMKNEHLADDGIGLPVPKRPYPDDEFPAHNCLLCLGETNDKLDLKSNYR